MKHQTFTSWRKERKKNIFSIRSFWDLSHYENAELSLERRLAIKEE
jgi:hypothetical protein